LEPLGDDIRRELGRFGPQGAIGATVEAWPEAVGPEIARSAWPARFQRDGTLIVHTRDSVWAFELTQRAGEIATRLDGVETLKFVPGPLPEPSGEGIQTTAPAVASPTPEQREQALEWTAEIADEDLRKIVTKAVEMSLANAPNDRSF
jgi:predicted nucleic acid-binding Zn ribbon protein